MFLNNSENVRLDKSTVDFQVRVRETDGAYINMQGDVMELVNKTIFVILPSLGYNLVTEIKGNQIKVVTTQERQMAIR